MVRVTDLDKSLEFYCNGLGMKEISRKEVPEGKFTLVFLAAADDEQAAKDNRAPMLELTLNWDSGEDYAGGRNFGHLAYVVDNIYDTCAKLQEMGVTINRSPKDGHMAFVRSPDGISVELLQKGESLAQQEPWASMANTGEW